ncbi:MAG: hypothetical protein CBD76_02845 [Pelagibacteraceae bacterium TMED216]|nr:MAG: hypothetical protein CBD76_02845 [Pelagibacteraceae bacterium TMED216]|tara:strand:- start:4636 stop:5505 length:870 start_codon:yes stop_codon:yes gene_type:complete
MLSTKTDLTVVLVTIKSEKVIEECIESIDQQVKIIVVENTNNKKFINKLTLKYPRIKCILNNENVGMGAGNNVGIKMSDTRFVMIMNPDTKLKKNTLDEIINVTKNLDFAVVAPLIHDKSNLNYKVINKARERENTNNKSYMEVDHVDGFCMILDKSKFQGNYFDENFFMYLENNDLCKRAKTLGKIFIIKNSNIVHIGAKSVDPIYNDEVELSRNWHWPWSKFYYNKKYHGFVFALIVCSWSFTKSLFKIIFFTITRNNFKKKIYINRASGYINSILGKKSWYRPKIQ